MELCDLRRAVCEAVDANRDEILAIANRILAHPELGFKEKETSSAVREWFERYGIGYTYPHARTGVLGTLAGRRQFGTVALMGEMDALLCPAHQHSVKGGAAHACGHFAQIAALLGAGAALRESGVMRELDGNVALLAAPAEEFIDLDARRAMREAGEIRYFGGKQQLIAEGAFDGVDCAMLLHAQGTDPERKLYVRQHNLGFRTKKDIFRGKAAHGSTPYNGTNALNAAALAILGIHANRETFRDEERIRIHPIITKGGDVVNSVPDEVVIEMYVRGATEEAIRKGSAAVDRAVAGAAQMIGATAETEDVPGYLPLRESIPLSEVMEETASALASPDALVYGMESVGSTDIGDLSCLIPVIQPSVGGFTGGLHAADFTLADPGTGILWAAKLLACTAAALLTYGAKRLHAVKERFTPLMTKEQYIAYLDNK